MSKSATLEALEALGIEVTALESSMAQVSGRVVAMDLTLEEVSETVLANTTALSEIQRSLGRLHDLVAEALDRTPPAAQLRR